MRKFLLALGAASLTIPTAMIVPTAGSAALARDRHYHDYGRHGEYRGREWRGRDGRTYCRKSDGTVGLLLGGAGGALAGRAIDTHGERTTGTVLGAAAGALLGNSIASKRHCG